MIENAPGSLPVDRGLFPLIKMAICPDESGRQAWRQTGRHGPSRYRANGLRFGATGDEQMPYHPAAEVLDQVPKTTENEFCIVFFLSATGEQQPHRLVMAAGARPDAGRQNPSCNTSGRSAP